MEARTRLGAQPLRVQTTTHAGVGGEARVLEARTRLGAQPLYVQSTIMRALVGGKGVGGSDSAQCAAAQRSIHNPYGHRWGAKGVARD